MGDCFEIRVEDAGLYVESLAVAVALGGGVESVGEFILGFRGATRLILQDHNLILIKGTSDEVEVVICGDHVNDIGETPVSSTLTQEVTDPRSAP